MRLLAFAALTLLTFASSGSSQGAVWVVDAAGGGGSHFTELQAAIDAAADGDTVLVRSGVYRELEIVDKGLAVVAEESAEVVIQQVFASGEPTVALVTGQTADQPVLLQGLRISPVPSFFINSSQNPGLRIVDTCGPVWLEDVAVFPNIYSGSGGTVVHSAGLRVENACSVSISRSELHGQNETGVVQSYFSSPGLVVVDSEVSVYDSLALAGFNELGTKSNGLAGPAGDGAIVENSQLFVSGSRFEGADGLDGEVSTGGCSGFVVRGGSGLVVLDPASRVYTLNSRYVPGQGGAAYSFTGEYCPLAENGVTIDAPEGTVFGITGRSYSLAIESPVRAGDSVTLFAEGDASEPLFLGASFDQGGTFLPHLTGVLQLGAPDPAVFLAQVGETGPVEFEFPLAPLGPGLESLVVYLQALLLQDTPVQTQGRFVLSAPTALVILNESL